MDMSAVITANGSGKESEKIKFEKVVTVFFCMGEVSFNDPGFVTVKGFQIPRAFFERPLSSANFRLKKESYLLLEVVTVDDFPGERFLVFDAREGSKDCDALGPYYVPVSGVSSIEVLSEAKF
jgi:hypothetical protein